MIMDYVFATLEGIVTFVSPCLLPMLPVYISFFAGGQDNRKKTLTSALGFVLGFSAVFVILGAFAGTFGYLLREYASRLILLQGRLSCCLG